MQKWSCLVFAIALLQTDNRLPEMYTVRLRTDRSNFSECPMVCVLNGYEYYQRFSAVLVTTSEHDMGLFKIPAIDFAATSS